MIVSRLLKSCATPPVSWPTASIFWDWRSASSAWRRSVMSTASGSTPVMAPCWSNTGRMAKSKYRSPIGKWRSISVRTLSPRMTEAKPSATIARAPGVAENQGESQNVVVPVPPVLAAMLRAHFTAYGTAPDGRLFGGARGGMLSESVYGRAWHAARLAALGPGLAATRVARRPYDQRHAALSLWLNASGDPAEIAARAGNSAASCITSTSTAPTARDDLSTSRSKTSSTPAPGRDPCPRGKASGCTDRRHHRGRLSAMCTWTSLPPGPPTARGPRRH